MNPATRTVLVTVLTALGALLPVATPHALAQTGVNSLFIGHSFFRPFADGMPFHAAQAGIAGHTQNVVFSGGASGAPQALWENPTKSAEIKAILDVGNVELFAMTYHGDYPTSEGYENWISYALAQNPNTTFALALPWGSNPESSSAAAYASDWHLGHSTSWHNLLDALRTLYPGVVIFCIPYGQSALELRLLLEAGNLDDVDFLVSATGDAIYRDTLGHADDILIDLGQLVWLNAIYDVDLATYAYDPGYITDLKGIAQSIMDDHDATYGEPPAPGCPDVPETGCRNAERPIFDYRNHADDGRDRLTYKWSRGESTSQAEFGNPTATTQYDLCIYGGAGATLIAEANVPADVLRWKSLSTKGYRYSDKLATADGTQRILLRGSDSSRSKVLWKGKGIELPDINPSLLPLSAGSFPLLLQVSGSTTTACFETSFENVDVVANETDRVKLKQ